MFFQPPLNQPRIEVAPHEYDANGLPLYSTLMDNVIMSEVSVANLNPTGEGMIQIMYAQALLDKAFE